MSVELGVVCPKAPEAEQVAQLVGPLMCMVWHSPLVHALIDDDRDRGWTVLIVGSIAVALVMTIGLGHL
jgi:hypothetical protein